MKHKLNAFITGVFAFGVVWSIVALGFMYPGYAIAIVGAFCMLILILILVIVVPYAWQWKRYTKDQHHSGMDITQTKEDI